MTTPAQPGSDAMKLEPLKEPLEVGDRVTLANGKVHHIIRKNSLGELEARDSYYRWEENGEIAHAAMEYDDGRYEIVKHEKQPAPAAVKGEDDDDCPECGLATWAHAPSCSKWSPHLYGFKGDDRMAVVPPSDPDGVWMYAPDVRDYVEKLRPLPAPETKAGEPITLDEIDRMLEDELGGWPNEECLVYAREAVMAAMRRKEQPAEGGAREWAPDDGIRTILQDVIGSPGPLPRAILDRIVNEVVHWVAVREVRGWLPIEEVPLDTDVLLYWPAKMGRTLNPAHVTVGQVHSLYHYAGATHWQPLPPPPAGEGPV